MNEKKEIRRNTLDFLYNIRYSLFSKKLSGESRISKPNFKLIWDNTKKEIKASSEAIQEKLNIALDDFFNELTIKVKSKILLPQGNGSTQSG